MSTQPHSFGGPSVRRLRLSASVIRSTAAGVLLFAGGVVGATWLIGSLDRTFAVIRGDEIIVEAIRWSDEGSPAAQRLSIVVANLAGEGQVILGATPDCPCLEFDGLPMKLPPRSRCVVHATPRNGSRESPVTKVILYTTSSVNPRVVVRFSQ